MIARPADNSRIPTITTAIIMIVFIFYSFGNGRCVGKRELAHLPPPYSVKRGKIYVNRIAPVDCF